MIVLWLGKISKLHPSQVQRNDTALGKIDAALLFIFHGDAFRLMANHIENGRCAPVDLVRFIEQRGGYESGHNFIAEFTNTIAVAGLDDPHLLELRC